MSDFEREVAETCTTASGPRHWGRGACPRGSKVASLPQASKRLAASEELKVLNEESSHFKGHLLSSTHICKSDDFKVGNIDRVMRCLWVPMLDHFKRLPYFLQDTVFFLLHHSLFGSLLQICAIHRHYQFFQAFAERWRYEMHTFHLLWERLCRALPMFLLCWGVSIHPSPMIHTTSITTGCRSGQRFGPIWPSDPKKLDRYEWGEVSYTNTLCRLDDVVRKNLRSHVGLYPLLTYWWMEHEERGHYFFCLRSNLLPLSKQWCELDH